MGHHIHYERMSQRKISIMRRIFESGGDAKTAAARVHTSRQTAFQYFARFRKGEFAEPYSVDDRHEAADYIGSVPHRKCPEPKLGLGITKQMLMAGR